MQLFKLFKQSSRRDSQFLRGERKSVCRDVVYLVGRRVLRARERGVSNTLLRDQRVRRRDRIGLDSAAATARPPGGSNLTCEKCIQRRNF